MHGGPIAQENLDVVDWRGIPAPVDDGSADHLDGTCLPEVTLPSTCGGQVNPGHLTGWNVLFFYPMTGKPGVPLPVGWDEIPGARGCTPQACAFRDLSQALADRGVSTVYGVSTQSTGYQREAVNRLHLPFALLSDTDLKLARALCLPTMGVDGQFLFKRLTLVLRGTRIKRVFYPVFPLDRNAADVLDFLDSSRV